MLNAATCRPADARRVVPSQPAVGQLYAADLLILSLRLCWTCPGGTLHSSAHAGSYNVSSGRMLGCCWLSPADHAA